VTGLSFSSVIPCRS